MWFYRAGLLQPETSSSLLCKMEFKIIDFVVAAFKVVGSSSRSIKGLGHFSYTYTTGAICLMAPVVMQVIDINTEPAIVGPQTHR